MRWWVWLVITLDLIILFLVGMWFYSAVGLKQYIRARQAIARLADQQVKEIAFREFYWHKPGEVYGGILAGDFFGKVWVWGAKGLRSFAADEYSAYSWFDGCSPEVLKQLNEGNWEFESDWGKLVKRETDTDFDFWRQKSKVGDYVRVYLATEEIGGKESNLREIYAYNFWLFMPWAMEERCAH